MKCSTCGQDNISNAQFCGICGTLLVVSQASGVEGTFSGLPMVKFPDAIMLGFSNYFSFRGRSTRAEYWWWVLFTIAGSSILGFVETIINVWAETGQASLLRPLFGLVTIVPSIALGSRRLHDIGKSGWWQLGLTLPILFGMILMILGVVFAFISGSDGDASLVALLILVGLGLCALVGTFVWWLRWFARQGEDGPNKYGSDPRKPTPLRS